MKKRIEFLTQFMVEFCFIVAGICFTKMESEEAATLFVLALSFGGALVAMAVRL